MKTRMSRREFDEVSAYNPVRGGFFAGFPDLVMNWGDLMIDGDRVVQVEKH